METWGLNLGFLLNQWIAPLDFIWIFFSEILENGLRFFLSERNVLYDFLVSFLEEVFLQSSGFGMNSEIFEISSSIFRHAEDTPADIV